MEQSKRDELLLIGLAIYVYLSNFAYTRVANQGRITPFPYDDQRISNPAYIDYGAKYISVCVIWAVLLYILPEYRKILFIIAMIFVGYLVEYIFIYNNPVFKLCYNNPVFKLVCFPIGYSTFATLCLIAFFIVKYLKK